MFRAVGSPFPRSFPGPRRSDLDWPWCPWSCGRSPWRSLPTLRSTSSRGTSHWSVTCWAFAACGRYVIPRRSNSSSTATYCGWRLVATLRNGDDVVTKSEVCVCATALHLSRVDWMNFDSFVLFGVVMQHARTPVPPEGRVRSDTADNLRTVSPLFRVTFLCRQLDFPPVVLYAASTPDPMQRSSSELFLDSRMAAWAKTVGR